MKVIMWLGIGLLLQSGVAALLWLNDGSDSAVTSAWQVQQNDITRLALSTQSEEAEQSVALIKSGDNWTLESHPELAVDQSKVQRVLAQLSRLSMRFPETTSQASHTRFKVAQDDYALKLDLGDAGQLYVGNTPAFKQVYVRPGKNDEVYRVELNRYDLSTEIDSWLEADLLSLDEVSQIRVGDLQLIKREESWTLRKAGEELSDSLDTDSLKAALRTLENLRVGAVSQASLEVVARFEAGDNDILSRYELAREDDQYWVRKAGIEGYWFKLSQSEFAALQSLSDPEQLLVADNPQQGALEQTSD
ncbi:DUF4340 domain-containing protein [Pseudoalteromonas sp. R3]|uniref:DUF4340 domain-containing protein n=1 Tax=Pseudoalteromonas sp. R3 TaxID=1709477 RepID=UPI0006B5A0A8|nr:DUF4340 domain-containing protein [Pseudoalteromonas sp. R3]AZZ98401.1 DUF4340 domain-containing protein [Pseudoalteromonas sp. R3]